MSLNLVALPIFLLTQASGAVHLNRSAMRLVDPAGLFVIKAGVLHTRRQDEDAGFAAALASLCSAAPARTLCLRSREGVTVLVMDFALMAPSGLVALRVSSLLATRPVPAARLMEVFGLTAAEARVAEAFLSGLVPAAIGALHGVARGTVARQLKMVRSKTGARSQAHLISLLLSAGEELDAR